MGGNNSDSYLEELFPHPTANRPHLYLLLCKWQKALFDSLLYMNTLLIKVWRYEHLNLLTNNASYNLILRDKSKTACWL